MFKSTFVAEGGGRRGGRRLGVGTRVVWVCVQVLQREGKGERGGER